MPRKRYLKYYSELELGPDASQDEIKTAYRRLALRFHPDKNRDHPERFPAITRAHQVLSKEKTRRLYDRFGEFGLGIYEKTGSVSLTTFLLDNRLQGWLLFFIILIFVILMAFPFLVAYKLAGNPWLHKCPWTLVGLPLWLLDTVIIVGMYFFTVMLYKSSKKSAPPDVSAATGLEELSRFQIVYSCLVFSLLFFLLVGSQVLTALRLDEVVRWPWWAVLTPYLSFEGLHIIFKAVDVVKLHRAWPGDDPVLGRTTGAYPYAVYATYRWSVMRVAMVTLLLVKATWRPDITWTVILAPAYISLLLGCFADSLYDRAYREATFLQGGRVTPRFAIYAKLAFSLVALAICLAFLGLLNAKLDFAEAHPRLTWILVFLPALIVFGAAAGFLVVCLPLLWCCFLSAANSTDYDEAGGAVGGASQPPAPPGKGWEGGVDPDRAVSLSTVNYFRHGFGLAPLQKRITPSPDHLI